MATGVDKQRGRPQRAAQRGRQRMPGGGWAAGPGRRRVAAPLFALQGRPPVGGPACCQRVPPATSSSCPPVLFRHPPHRPAGADLPLRPGGRRRHGRRARVGRPLPGRPRIAEHHRAAGEPPCRPSPAVWGAAPTRAAPPSRCSKRSWVATQLPCWAPWVPASAVWGGCLSTIGVTRGLTFRPGGDDAPRAAGASVNGEPRPARHRASRPPRCGSKTVGND